MWRTLALALAALGAPAAFAGPATPAGPFTTPFGASLGDRYMTAAFDLDPGSGQADWTGWLSGDPTPGNGHAYDGHTGTDWGMPNGTELYACQSGTVNSLYEGYPNDDHSGGGNYVILDHTISGVNWRSRHWHLAQNGVIPGVGQAVTQGQLIAYSDNTGNSTGPHLHFGLSNLSATGLTTCGFFNGWYTEDEWYYGDGRPCSRFLKVTATTLNIRTGTSTAYPIVTTAPLGARFVASQRNGWYRLFLPCAPSRAYESRTAGGGVTTPPAYTETGTWLSAADKSAVSEPPGDANRTPLTGAGSRYSEFTGTGGSDTAQFVPTITQRGFYEVFTTWPAQANAQAVTYRINHLGGQTDVVLPQTPLLTSPGGTGTHADPHVITTGRYVADHTTVGGDDLWDSYSPAGAGIPENGPERIYTFTLHATATVTATVNHTGYPGLDVDVQLLNTLSNADCVARGDWTASATFAPGTHFISIDSYGTDNSRATAYTLTVEIDGPFPNSWVSLGSYEFDLGTGHWVTVLESSVTGVVTGALPGRVYVDAVKFVPAVQRSAWFSDAYVSVLDGAADSVCTVGVAADATAGSDARELSQMVEVPIHAEPDINSPVVGKAVTGQRFVCTNIWNDFYRVFLTNACDAPAGWISGAHLFVHHPERAAEEVPAGIVVFGTE